MNDETNASYAFLPWMRRGLATAIQRTDGESGEAAPRVDLDIDITINAGGTDKHARLNLGLYGPGEIGGIDPRVIIRTYPKADEPDAEPNYFPAVDFDQPDFPWRYTPAKANIKQRLRPWLALVVLTADEIDATEPAGTDGRLASITVKSATTLPRLNQSWAWAHAQISAVDATETDTIADIVNNQPQRCISRLLCPRRLLPRIRYLAYLVPTFERARRAGLNETMDDTLDGLAPAWTQDASNVRLPVYYRWSFQTGIRGDFEYLARQLRARITPADIGKKDLDVSDPGLNLPTASDTALEMEGALMSPQTSVRPWDPAQKANFVEALGTLVNSPTDLLTDGQGPRIIAPPLYGRWYAARDRMLPDQAPLWFNQINADPRWRSGCGLGTQVIQAEQQALMASAWDQLDRLLELQEQYRHAQMSRAISKRFKQRHVDSHDDQTTLLLTAPLHSRILARRRAENTAAATVQSTLLASPISDGLTEAQFRRITRPLGPIGRRQGRDSLPRETQLLGRMNRGELSAAPPPITPQNIATHARVNGGAVPGWLTLSLLNWLRFLPGTLLVIAILLWLIASIISAAAIPFPWPASVIVGLGVALAALAAGVYRRLRKLRLRVGMRDGHLNPSDILAAAPARGFMPREAAPGSQLPPTVPGGVNSGEDRIVVNNFKTALADIYRHLNSPVDIPASLIPVDFTGLKRRILFDLDPQATIVAPFKARVKFAPWVRWQYESDPIEPPMPAPEFEQPMYKPLRDLSSEWILPGAGEIPANTVSLLVTNQRFIETYMLGCNHEMTRELRYHEFPIDQRGTYFQFFWESVEVSGQTPDREQMKDIRRIHQWLANRGPGHNSARRPPPGGEHLVLIIRGEIFRRYPNTIVYASKARIGGSEDGANAGRRIPDSEEKSPVFQGQLDPDIHFFGFELTKDQVRGDADGGADQGWFFMLEEQISEPRFGLDVPEFYGRRISQWDDLSWSDLVSDAAGVDSIGYIDLDADLPDTSAVTSAPGQPAVVWHADAGLGATGSRASDIAYITLQKPFRVAIHGVDMLPPE